MDGRRQNDWLLGSMLSTVAALALFVHARTFDFVCDDAFITFRYAANLATSGSPVYNPGERVEGYTNFLWMIASAALYRFVPSVQSITLVLGWVSAMVLMCAVYAAWAQSHALARWTAVLPMAAVAVTAPVATWTLSGLETVLYAGLVLLACAVAARSAARGGRLVSAAAGALFALATLTRPEGAVPMGLFVMTLLVVRRREGLRDTACAVATYAALVGPFVAWRWSYYGHPLPNTFYLKVTGDAAELRSRGLRYLALAARDFGIFSAPLVGALCVPVTPRNDGEAAESFRGRRVLVWLIRMNVVVYLAYVVSVGGDFLGMYRFLVPVLPLAIVGAALGAAHLLMWAKRPPLRAGVLAGTMAALALYGKSQIALSASAKTEIDPEKASAGIEPISWTRLYARRWAATGRWIAEHSREGDSLAVGAAGAMPFYSRLPNLDVLGLCDEYVARHGIVVGSRPGHQRRAPLEYTLSRRPVFLFEGDFVSDERQPLPRDPTWEARGYSWVEARISQYRYGAPSPFYFYFLMRTDCAGEIHDDPNARVATL